MPYPQAAKVVSPAWDRVPGSYAVGKNEREGHFFLGMHTRAEQAIRSAFTSLSAAFLQAGPTAGAHRHPHAGRAQLLGTAQSHSQLPAWLAGMAHPAKGDVKPILRVILQLDTLWADQHPGDSPAGKTKLLMKRDVG